MIQLGSNGEIKEMWAVARVYQGGQLVWQADWASSSSSSGIPSSSSSSVQPSSSSAQPSSSSALPSSSSSGGEAISSSSSSSGGDYPNAFVVSGFPNNVDTRHAQYNGTYTKTASTTTTNGASYPIYSNGVI